MVDSWTQRAARYQRILNGLPIPPRRLQRDLWPEVHVQARIVWEHDGEQLVNTVAYAYTTRAALVRLADDRQPTLGAWLLPGDVRRV